MSEELKSKMVLPARLAVLICKQDASGNLYPLTRLDERDDGHIVVSSGLAQAPLGIPILERAHAKCVQVATEQAAHRIHAKLSAGLNRNTDAAQGVPTKES